MFDIIKGYFGRYKLLLLGHIFSVVLFLCVLLLARQDIRDYVYALLIGSSVLLIFYGISFAGYYKEYEEMIKIRQTWELEIPQLKAESDRVSEEKNQLIEEVVRAYRDAIDEEEERFHAHMEYYTLWVHQAKTPIAAMDLLLQAEPEQPQNTKLKMELFQISQYVDMALQFLRIEMMSADLAFAWESVKSMVRESVKKFSAFFIRKKLSLNLSGLDTKILTDRKWFCFVLEQLISNAIKYTQAGGISIYTMTEGKQQYLVIEDTGIGIEENNLPRIFERGFTGYNGRMNKKSTGIGLSMCVTILNELSHELQIEAVAGQGTKAKILISRNHLLVE